MEFQKIVSFLDTTSDNKDVPKFVTKKLWSLWSITRKLWYNKKIRIKTSMLRRDLCDFSDAYILVMLLIEIMQKEVKPEHLKIMLHLSTVFQRLME